ncbi:MAG: TRAP transporter small permease [Gudongella sp.]|nr:TRAP transporter small permease [Gudongella sp.]
MKVLRWLDEYFEEAVLVSSLVVTVGLIFMQVIMRYVFRNSLSWSEELARYIFLYQIWLGASYATKKKAHLRIEIIKSKFSGRKGAYFETVVMIIWLAFTVFLTLESFNLTRMIFIRGQLSPAMRMPMGFAYASVPIGAGLMSLRLIQNIVSGIKGIPQAK